MFEAITKIILATLIGIIGVLFLIVAGTLAGACFGWLVGLMFGDTILYALSRFGVTNVSMWQYGAFLGFTGSFFKATLTQKDKDKDD